MRSPSPALSLCRSPAAAPCAQAFVLFRCRWKLQGQVLQLQRGGSSATVRLQLLQDCLLCLLHSCGQQTPRLPGEQITPLHHIPRAGQGVCEQGAAWLLLRGAPWPRRCRLAGSPPSPSVKCTRGANEQSHSCPLSVAINWWSLLGEPGTCNGALWKPSSGECRWLSANSRAGTFCVSDWALTGRCLRPRAPGLSSVSAPGESEGAAPHPRAPRSPPYLSPAVPIFVLKDIGLCSCRWHKYLLSI